VAGFLDLLTPPVRNELLRGARKVHVAAGTTYEVQRAAPIAFVVESGLIRLFVSSQEGRQASVVYLHPEDTYAALEIIPAARANLQALTDSTVLMLEPDNLARLATHNLAVSEATIRIMGRELARLVRIITVRSLGSMTERLAFDLLERSCEAQLRKGGELVCHATHEQLADSIGSVREVVARIVGDLRSKGVVVTSPRRIRVVDPVRLARIVRGLTGSEDPSN
jgi:CRP/FNR family transcriptional regulator, cyclic AMP receptor protein